MELLKIKSLCKTYGKGNAEVKALKPTDLTINKGEFVAIVGPSGSGKSTLLHLMSTLDKPTGGEVILEGKSILKLSENKLSDVRRKKFGFIFQSFNLIPVLTAEENIKLPLGIDGEKIDEDYVNELISLLGLEKRINHYPNELSGGQQQRVAIARALAGKPSIIFADEPTGNLDSKTTEEVLNMLQFSIRKFNQTLIMITHDNKVASYADRIVTIIDGNITSDKFKDSIRKETIKSNKSKNIIQDKEQIPLQKKVAN
ncbi:ABC transporter ATP-binding protein (plasmid) [Haloimpatiens sp. FM7330]|uniref:ABC transporter ATP-binding protein n=1 Tax=Haloimpatiens sp. FM7330 TaxID=3298610 RepID=UPI00363ADC7A